MIDVKRNRSAPESEFEDLVLLMRGPVGCRVCFLDKETERFVRSRMELSQQAMESR